MAMPAGYSSDEDELDEFDDEVSYLPQKYSYCNGFKNVLSVTKNPPH